MFSRMMFFAFLARTLPAQSMAKPACGGSVGGVRVEGTSAAAEGAGWVHAATAMAQLVGKLSGARRLWQHDSCWLFLVWVAPQPTNPTDLHEEHHIS